ncbi:MAG: ABC transporter substrate-binding protein [bacterium]|nr:ABC transporter substrate-binding protein [bacterium]
MPATQPRSHPARRSLAIFLTAALTLVASLPGCGTGISRRTDTLIFAKAKDATRLDPADTVDAESTTVTENICEGLVRFADGSCRIEPALATRWDVSPDGRTWTFHLRPGVRFHDGTPFDARAVKLSFDRQRKPGPGQVFEFWASFFAPVLDRVEVVDPRTVRMRLKVPDATFLANLAIPSMSILSPTALANEDAAAIARHPVGTGPFRFVRWVRGERIVLERNLDYWDGPPRLRKLVFKPVPENAVRLLELEVGAVDAMDGINPDDVARVERNPELRLASAPGMNVGYLAFNVTRKPLDDVRVRRAIRLALDKPALVKAFFAGGRLGQAAVNPMPPALLGYAERLVDPAPDLSIARRLLAEAGLAGGFELPLWALPVARPYMPQGQRTAEAIQAALQPLGIRVNIQSYEWGTYLDKLGRGDHTAALMGWIGDNGDPDNFLYTMFDANNARPGGGASNYCFYRDPAVHAWLTEARLTTVLATRTRLYRQVQERLHDDVPCIPLFHARQLVAMRGNVRGFALHPTGVKRFARVWLEGDAP